MNIFEITQGHLTEFAKAKNYKILDDGLSKGNQVATVMLQNGTITGIKYQAIADYGSSLEVEASGMRNGKSGNLVSSAFDKNDYQHLGGVSDDKVANHSSRAGDRMKMKTSEDNPKADYGLWDGKASAVNAGNFK